MCGAAEERLVLDNPGALPLDTEVTGDARIDGSLVESSEALLSGDLAVDCLLVSIVDISLRI